MFEFFVRATDRGQPSRESDVTVEILVVSPLESLPAFPKDTLRYSISEDRDVGSIIATMAATMTTPATAAAAVATASNETLRYSIVAGTTPHTNSPPRFTIDAVDGTLSVGEPLDREELETFQLTVMAATVTSPPLVAYCLVTVLILDVNDNAPRFESNPYAVAVAENARVGASVAQVLAHDADTGANGDVTYSFEPQHSSISGTFALNPETGWITTLVELDRERVDAYAFNVVARDRGTEIQRSDVTDVRISVMDHNDNPPKFNVDIYQGQVAEDALLGKTVLSVRTVDYDLAANADVTYYIISGDVNGQFAIGPTSGEIIVNKALDREVTSHYELQVAATDGAFVSTALVRVKIVDANDNAPQCETVSPSRQL